MASDIKIEGIEELIAAFALLMPEIQNKSGRSAMRKMARAMTDKAIANAPVGETGNLVNSLRPSVRVMKGAVVAFTKSSQKGGFNGKGNHAHLIEFGHKLVKGKGPRRKTIGFVKAYPFLRPTLYGGRDKWLQMAVEGVEASLKKLEKKGRVFK